MDLLKNMQDLQGKMAELQGRLSQIRAEGSSGGGMVSMVLNGRMQVLDVKIAPEAVDPDDIGMLEDLVLAAANAALSNLQEELKNQTASELTGGLSIPGFPGF